MLTFLHAHPAQLVLVVVLAGVWGVGVQRAEKDPGHPSMPWRAVAQHWGYFVGGSLGVLGLLWVLTRGS